MKKIIGFDSWTQGSHFFEYLVSAMEEKGYQLILIHVGSWGHDTNRPKEEKIGKLLVRDISYYEGLSFPEILRKEKPDGVLFLSMQAYAHRAFNRYCKFLKIPTLHLYHGLVTIQAVSSKKMLQVNWKSQLSIFLRRFWSNLVIILPTYIGSLFHTKAPAGDWKWFFKDIARKLFGTSYSQDAAPDTETEGVCVYTESDIFHAIERYHAKLPRVIAVGNPDLDLFGLHENLINSYKIHSTNHAREIIYIDTALTEAGAIYDSKKDFINHLLETSEALAKQNYKLVIKLHPAHSKNGVLDLAKQENLTLCEKEHFIDKLITAKAVIVEPSSAAILPALMGLPVLLAQYGRLNNQEYGDMICTYPRNKHLNKISDTSHLINEIEINSKNDACADWIKLNAGPIPSTEMPKRVVNFFDMIIRSSLQNVGN